ncbi:ABC-2 type transport system ATP-binding protein [Elusimicrobium simillimum]|uniref:ABC transporter ATP-binding protein n=1 Tax=Elusimicrobium simillimum TaxID=3143438 RepID=UPI003C6FC93C
MTQTTQNEIIRVENLVIAFGSFKAVNDISFEVNKGEIFGFLGANGAGKTTTIRTICGILNPTSGKVFVNGRDVSADTSTLKPHIGYMSQKFTLYKDLTVKENMEFAGALYDMNPKDVEKRSKELFKFIDFTYDEDTIVASLSGGVKQMVSLCATLLHNPDLVFLDEPTAGVSPQVRVAFWGLIRNLAKEGKTIFVTTHYMDEAAYCDRIVLMNMGKIVAFGTPAELTQKYFPHDFVELAFNADAAREDIKNKINQAGFAKAESYGLEVRAEITDKAAFDKFAAENKNIFTVKDSPATLEDVFLKVVSNKAVEA